MLRRASCLPIACLTAVCCAWSASVSIAFGASPEYSSPHQLRWDAAGQTLGVWEAGTDTICTVDPVRQSIVRREPRPDRQLVSPAGFSSLSPNGKWCAWIDPWEARLLIADIPPAGLSGITPAACRQIPLGAHANPQALTITSDGRRVLVACDTPGGADRTVAIVTVESGQVEHRPIPGSSNLRGIAVDPEGTYALVVHLRPKSHLPSTQIEQGWVFTNAVTYISLDSDRKVVSLPLDLRTQGFANPEGVVIDSRARFAYVSHAGADVVSVIDLAELRKQVDGVPANGATGETRETYTIVHGDDFRITRRYVLARIAVGASPRAMALSPDGKTLAVANRLSDSISLIDTGTRRVSGTVLLTKQPIDLVRRGEMLFHSGKLAFGAQFSCASCHPDGQSDGLNWDLPADGFNNFHNTKSLLSTAGTQPYGWLGESSNLRERFTGTLRHLFQCEPEESDVAALEAYLAQLAYGTHLPSRVDPQSAAAQRGKALFRGKAGCVTCHRGTYFTDQRSHDVGTGKEGGKENAYDTPSLLHIAETAPYLHDGRAPTLETIFREHNPQGAHGNAAELTPEEFADLIEYLKSL